MTRRPWERGGRHLVAKFASTWQARVEGDGSYPPLASHLVDGSNVDLVAKFASTWTSQGGRRRFLFNARHPPCVDGSDVWRPEALIHVQKLVQREDCLAKIRERLARVRLPNYEFVRCGKFIVFGLS